MTPQGQESLPVIVARIGDYGALQRALRQRAADLGLTRAGLDEAMVTLPDGYASKLLSPMPSRRLGLMSVFPMLAGLGLDLLLVNSPEKRARWSDKAAAARKRAPGKTMRKPLPHALSEMPERRGLERQVLRETMRKLGKKGGRKSAQTRKAVMSPAKRRRLAKRAAQARWSRRDDARTKPELRHNPVKPDGAQRKTP